MRGLSAGVICLLTGSASTYVSAPSTQWICWRRLPIVSAAKCPLYPLCMAVSNSHTWPLVSATQDTSANSRTPLQDSGTLQLIAGQTVNPPETLNVNSTVGRHNYSLCSFLSPCNFLIPVFYIFYTVLPCFLNRAVPDFASGSGWNPAVFLN